MKEMKPPDRFSPLDIGVFGARDIPSTYSGYETFLTELLPALASRGHKVTMYTRRSSGSTAGSVYRGVHRRPLPEFPGKNGSTLSHGAVASARASVGGHDVLLVVNVANALFTWLPRLLGTSVVLNTDGQEWLRGKWGRNARKIFLVSAQIAKFAATSLVCDSLEMQSIYRSRFKSDSTLIPYAALSLPPAPVESLAEFGLSNLSYILVGGRLVPENNIVEIVKGALSPLLSKDLVVIGGANYNSPVLQELQAIRDPRLKILGHIDDRRSFARLLASAAIYVHGHSVGGINPSLLEAMALGANILALDTPFNREALGGAGQFFEDFDVGLQDALLDLLNKGAGEALARSSNVDRALTLFSLDSCVDAYELTLASAAAVGRARGIKAVTHWETLMIAENLASVAAADSRDSL